MLLVLVLFLFNSIIFSSSSSRGVVSFESFGCRSTGLLGLGRRLGLGGRDRSGSDDGGRDPCVREFRGF